MSSRALPGPLCFVPLLFASLSAAPPSTTPPATDRTVAQIAQDRFELASKGYDIAQARFKQGTAGYDPVIEWHRQKALAANDLPDAAQRNQVLQDYVTALKGEITKAERGVKAGVRSEDESMRVRLNELEGELWLARSKERAK